MKEGAMGKKMLILLMVVVLGGSIFGCAGEKSMVKPTPTQILPVKVTVDSVERLNAIAAKPPFQPTDLLVFRVNFKLSNPNNVPAKVDDLYFEAKVDDGTPDKTIVQAVSMPNYLVPAGGEIVWSSTEPFLYGGVRASYLLRGVGGAEGVKGVFAKMEELWIDLGADKRKFLIDGNITTSLPDAPNLGIVRTQFKTEFAIPKL
jgi:hypothetical protein